MFFNSAPGFKAEVKALLLSHFRHQHGHEEIRAPLKPIRNFLSFCLGRVSKTHLGSLPPEMILVIIEFMAPAMGYMKKPIIVSRMSVFYLSLRVSIMS